MVRALVRSRTRRCARGPEWGTVRTFDRVRRAVTTLVSVRRAVVALVSVVELD